MLRFSSLAILLPLCLPAATPPQLRLPAAVRPLSYAVELNLTPGSGTFTGRASIELDVSEPTATIWLHAKDLVIAAARTGGAPAHTAAAANDLLAITPAHPLAPGATTLVIDYSGIVSHTLTDGVFEQLDRADWYLFTKFEPVTARRAFPCFDEPSFKAPWQLTLHIPAALQAFSNTPTESEAAAPDGTKSVRFARTAPLPSYLIALAVGPFETVAVPPIGRNRVPGRIVVPRGRAAEAAAAAAATPQVVARLEDYFGIPYPFAKLDQIVVPLTASWGAMENAGLIAYSQALLTKPGEDTPPRERGRLSLMLHETAHQWFGDYTTPHWWDDIWLNEGFATWLGSKLLGAWHPEWNVLAGRAGSTSSIMTADSFVSARRVRQPIEAPGDIANAFDGITYSKGAAILGMVESWLGEDVFRRGIRAHLAAHPFGSASTTDLIAALDRASGRDVNAAFSSFLDRSGAPLITANVRCGGGAPVLHLRQERMLPVGSTAAAATATDTWTVPVCYRWSDGAQEHRACVTLATREADFPLAATHPPGKSGAAPRSARVPPDPLLAQSTVATPACPAWFLANDSASGYYRTAYAAPWTGRLLERGLPHLPPLEQSALLQNVQALLAAGKFDVRQAVALARPFIDSKTPETLGAALGIVGTVGQAATPDLEPAYARFVRDWVGPRARQLGWQPKPGESLETRAIRLAIVPTAAIAGEDAGLGAEAQRLAGALLIDRSAADRDVAPSILAAAARRGDRALFDRMLAALRRTTGQKERTPLIGALGAFPDPRLTQTALDLILHPGGLDPRELRTLTVPQRRETQPAVWEFVRRHFDELNAALPGARGIPFGATLPAAAGAFCEASRAAEVEAFFQPKLATLSGAARNLARTLETIRLCAARRKALAPGARELLTGN
jgi:cytosol alanyl aminopeptidase